MIALRAGDVQPLAALEHLGADDLERGAAADGDGAVVVAGEALVVLAAQVADDRPHQLEAGGAVDPDALEHVVGGAPAQAVADAPRLHVRGGEAVALIDHQARADAAAARRDPVQGEAAAVLDPDPGIVLHVALDQGLVVLVAADHRHMADPEVGGAFDQKGAVVVGAGKLAQGAVGEAAEVRPEAQLPRDPIDEPSPVHRTARQGPLQGGGVVGLAVALRPERQGAGVGPGGAAHSRSGAESEARDQQPAAVDDDHGRGLRREKQGYTPRRLPARLRLL